jgi:hypothetical protein
MIRDGRMPTPDQARKARAERLKRDRERRAKQPGEIKRRAARAERDRLFRAYWDAKNVEQQAERYEPIYEVLADVSISAIPIYGRAIRLPDCATG